MRLKYRYQEEAGEGLGGTPAARWQDSLPDDMKGSSVLATLADVPAMAKSYLEMTSLQGASIRIPGNDASDQVRAEFADKILARVPNVMLRPDMENQEQSRDFYRLAGMPEKAEMYEMPEVANPNDAPVDEDKIAAFREIAHEIGLNKDQFRKFMGKVLEQDITDDTQRRADKQTGIDELSKEWGVATQERINQALSIAEKTKAPEGIIKGLKDGDLPPELTKWIYDMSISLGSEGNNTMGLPDTQSGRMTPQEAKDQIAEIMNNKGHGYYKGEKAAMDRMVELMGFAHPDASRDINDLRRGTMY